VEPLIVSATFFGTSLMQTLVVQLLTYFPKIKITLNLLPANKKVMVSWQCSEFKDT